MASVNKKDKSKKIFWLFTFLLTGCVFAMSMCGIFMGGRPSIYIFYNVGDVYEVRDIVYKTVVDQRSGHQETDGRVVLDEGLFRYSFPIEGNEDKWNYFCFELGEIVPASTLQCTISFEKVENGEMTAYAEHSYQLKAGLNVLDIPKNSFNVIVIRIYGEPGTSVYVKSMQFRENAPTFSLAKAAGIFGIAFCLYGIFIGILLFLRKKIRTKYQPYGWIDILQTVYIRISEEIRKILKVSASARTGYIRTALFFLIFVYNVYVTVADSYQDKFKYHLAFYAIVILAISILSVEDKLKKQNWNNALVWSWLLLWAMASISDFLVPKSFGFLGYVMVLGLGFFFFVWSNMQDKTKLIRDFTLAIHFFFVFVTVFCLLFRPETGDARYSGITRNPSVFALYLAIIWTVVLGEFEHWLKSDKSLVRLLPFSVEGCFAVAFLWKSQAAWPILCVALVSLVWFLKMVCGAKAVQRKRTAITIFLSLFLLLPSYLGLTWGLRHVSPAIGSQVAFSDEIPAKRQTWGMVVNAADLGEKLKESRLAEKFAGASLSSILSGRDYYYRAYLRNMNLVGHEKKPLVWGHRRLPHNAVLGIAYRYGVFASIPYILMLILTLIRTFKFSIGNKRYSGIPFYVCLVSIAMSMADNVEQPFLWLPWIALYLMMGVGFSEEEKSIDLKMGN